MKMRLPLPAIIAVLLLIILLQFIFCRQTKVIPRNYFAELYMDSHESPRENGLKGFITLVTNDEYAVATRKLIISLRKTQTVIPIICMHTDLSPATRKGLTDIGCRMIQVDSIDSPYKNHDSRWKGTMTKLNAWTLTNYEKLVYLDSDCLILENIDDLFSRQELSATLDPNVDYFNSGMMVLRPSQRIYDDMISKLGKIDSYDGYDQGFLNSYFRDSWHPLPFAYNADQNVLANSNVIKGYKVIHYSLQPKPWNTLNVLKWENSKQKQLHELWHNT
jgi:alpha-N-acetylglucosamine transferase